MGLLVTLAAGVMTLFAMSASALLRVRHRTSALILAVEKLEQLRAVALTEGVADLVGQAGPQTEYLDAEGGTVDPRLGGIPSGGALRAGLARRPTGRRERRRPGSDPGGADPSVGLDGPRCCAGTRWPRLTTLLWTP